jgi:hypothetical protein
MNQVNIKKEKSFIKLFLILSNIIQQITILMNGQMSNQLNKTDETNIKQVINMKLSFATIVTIIIAQIISQSTQTASTNKQKIFLEKTTY